MSKNFNFFCPIEVTKAKDDKGQNVMRLGGIASTMDKDSDGEFLDPSGFQISDFKKVGVVNWHHGASESPSTIIGEPHKAELRKEGFYVETNLYPSSPLAQEVYELAEVMQKDSPNRRLGYSIEGSVIERASDDKTHPDYNIIKRAKITGLAITHMPKNAMTFAEIIKGNLGGLGGIKKKETNDSISKNDEDPCWDDYEKKGTKKKNGKDVPNCVKKKSLDTSSGAPLVKESVDGKVKNLKKGGYQLVNLDGEKMYDLIFDTFPTITIEKAEKVFNLFNKIDNNMKKGEINEGKLKKAMEFLGFNDLEENPFLQKAKDTDDMSDQEVADAMDKKMYVEDEDTAEKGDCSTKKGEDDEDDEDEMEMGKMEKGTKGTVLILKKAIEKSEKNQLQHTKALGQLVKATLDQNEILKGEIDGLKDSNQSLGRNLEKAQRQIARLGRQSAPRRSITKGFREKDSFQKAQSENTGPTLSMKGQYNQVLDLVDNACFAKGGYDEEFAKATSHFEINKNLPSNIISRIKSEMGVTIVD